jgi:hypothetical protein
MEDLSFELIVSIFEYIEQKDILVSLTKSLFHLRHFFQIQINEKININNYSDINIVKLYKNVCFTTNIHKNTWKNIRAKKVEIDCKNIPDFFNDYKYNYEYLKIKNYADVVIDQFPKSIKTLIVMKTVKINLSIELPHTLRKLIMPGSYMNKYPENLLYLICSHNPNQKLNKLKKMCITDEIMRYDDEFPANLKVLTINCENEIPMNLPFNLKQLSIKSKNDVEISNLPTSIKTLHTNSRIYSTKLITLDNLSIPLIHIYQHFLKRNI